VIEVSRRRPAADSGNLQGSSRFQPDLLQMTVSIISKHEIALGVGHAKFLSIHLWIHVSVRNEYIGPSIIVEIRELYAEAQEWSADRSEARRSGHVGELAVAIIAVKIVHVVGEIDLGDVQIPVAIVVGGVYTHTGLFHAVRAVGDACGYPILFQSPPAVPLVQEARR
jgi:hypothetical protein